MQRVKIEASSRFGRDAERAATYLGEILAAEGATVLSARGVAKKRGGRVQVLADATAAADVVLAARAKLDGESNGYARDLLDEIHMAAFESDHGGILAFATEDYRSCREGS